MDGSINFRLPKAITTAGAQPVEATE